MDSNTFPQNNEFKSNLTYENLSGNDLKNHLILTFGSFKSAAKEANISEDRLHQIFMGYAVPKSPEIIRRLAEAWKIDLVVFIKILEKINAEEKCTQK